MQTRTLNIACYNQYKGTEFAGLVYRVRWTEDNGKSFRTKDFPSLREAKAFNTLFVFPEWI